MTTAIKANTAKSAKLATHQSHGRSKNLITTKKPIFRYMASTKKLPVASVTKALCTRIKRALKRKKALTASTATKQMMFTRANRETCVTAAIMKKAGTTMCHSIMI